ncbi:MAG: M15 family metallopeptidase [Actinomycetota bacterium]
MGAHPPQGTLTRMPWRRWAFLAVVAALGVAAVALTMSGPPGETVPAGARAEGGAARDAATEAVTPAGDADGGIAAPEAPEPAAPEPPPYFLAWTPGGLPFDFRAQVRTVGGLESTVVVAGDTRWLSRSLDAGGDVIDRPEPPLAIPIDAFSVNPVEIAPFLPAGVRGEVVDALARGQGVLGTRSAVVRRLGVGGTLEFGDHSVRVGAVVPEELIGWSELLVSREVGMRLGIVDDRYLWAFPSAKPGLEAFEGMVRPLIPAVEPLRVEGPGDSPYMRVANGVNPPVVLKQAFGEFAAALDPANPASFRIDPAWTDANLVTRSVPLLGKLTCHRVFMEDLVRAMHQVEREGLGSLVHSTAGCFNARTVARSPTNPPSFHAYGAAVDINAPENAFGATPTMDPRIVAIFEDLGFNWGGDFLIPDGMHFEYGGGPLATAS